MLLDIRSADKTEAEPKSAKKKLFIEKILYILHYLI